MALSDNIRPVPAARPANGLLATVGRTSDGNDWALGMAWRPERCGFTAGGVPACEPHNKAALTGSDVVYYRPGGFYVAEQCTTLDARDMAEVGERVRRQVDAVTSFMAAAELWDGRITRTWQNPADSQHGSAWSNPYLADGNATAVAGTFATALEGLAALEAEAMRQSYGQQVFLHVNPEWVAYLGDYVTRTGSTLLTKLDNVVVADGGYPGTGTVSGGTAEVQTVEVTGAPTGGTYTLTYDGQTTAPIPFDADAAAVASALVALPNLFPGDIAVDGTNPFTVTFDAVFGDVPQITGDGAGLTGGTAPAVATATTTPGVAPAGADALTAYATGPVQVRYADLDTLELPGQVVDRTTNRYTVYGERLFAATFDPCLHLSAEVTALSG